MYKNILLAVLVISSTALLAVAPPALKGMYIREKMPAYRRWCSGHHRKVASSTD